MHFPPLGTLRVSNDIEEWMISEPVTIPYFETLKLRFTLWDLKTDKNPDDFVSAVRRFLKMNVASRYAASEYVFKNYAKMVDAVGEEDVGFLESDPLQIWKHVYPNDIYVSRRKENGKIYCLIAAGCKWEPEHGLQIVYRDGDELCRVSAQDGHLTYCDAYDKPESEDRIC